MSPASLTALHTDLQRKMELREALLSELHALDAELDGYFRVLNKPRKPYTPALGRVHAEPETLQGLIRAALLTGPLSEPGTRAPFKWLLGRCEDIPGADAAAIRETLSGLLDRGVIQTSRGVYWRVA